MTTATARERLAAILGEVAAAGSFSAQRLAPVDDLHLDIRGLGRLVLPVPGDQAAQLCKLGRPAAYGRGEETLLNRRVRDTWEIPKARVKVDKRQWNKTLLPMLDRLRGDLGLPSGCQLKAELHSMLVYARGQFFVPHQDSEKADAMVGTLVVTLPSSFKGGALMVEHIGETTAYRSTKKSISFVAFYADCRHQVRPITSGYRIVLTYNLLLQGDAAATASTDTPPGTVDAVAGCIDEHFTTPVPLSRRSVDPAATDPPDRLVYLLDHEYTERGLSWSRLKGDDARRAAVLREAAAGTDCDIVLALADIHQTWSCLEPEWDGYRHGRRRSGRWDDRDDDDFGEAWTGDEGPTEADGYELDQLIDWSVTLDCWIDPAGERAQPVATSVGDTEVCATTPSAALQPYSSEYEGYMGNYGNTMDRWYRRAALVLWPRRRTFAVRAEASPSWAVEELWAKVRARDVAGAREMADTLVPFWDTVAHGELVEHLLTKALRVARALDHPALAAMLLKPYRVEMLGRRHASALVALVEGYGEQWTQELIATWSGLGHRWTPSGGQGRLKWLASLPRLCEALQATGATGTSAPRLLVEDSWHWLQETVEQRRRLAAPSRRDQALAELAGPILAVLESTEVIVANDLRDDVLALLCDDSDDLLTCLTALLRAASALPQARRAAAGIDAIARHCAARLEARLAHPRRADDDWSIDVPRSCDCRLCDVLSAFLIDPSRRSFDWPLATDGRRHVHSRLDSAELPVLHQTRRAGRPYTLVLTKTGELHERDRQARRRDEADLAWLIDQ